MVTININGRVRHITPLSKLSFDQFNAIIVKGGVSDLKEYLSVYLDIPIHELMEAELKSSSLPALHQMIFDVDLEQAIKNPPKTFTYKGEIHIVEELRLATFGKNYFFDLYHGQHTSGKINQYELSLYALSIAISHGNDMDNVEKIYAELCRKNWRLVLPVAFFLLKKSIKKRKGSMLSLMTFTWELKRIAFQNRWALSRLKRMERIM